MTNIGNSPVISKYHLNYLAFTYELYRMVAWVKLTLFVKFRLRLIVPVAYPG